MANQDIHQVSFEGVRNKRRAAFVIFHAKTHPWSSYREDDARKNLEVPVCLMVFRSDGSFGFVGGGVDGDESLIDAVLREVVEEIGYRIEPELKQVVAHDTGPITTHAFSCQVSEDMIYHIRNDATKASDMDSEITGVVLPHLVDYESLGVNSEGGIVELLKCSMATSVREELVHFLLNENLFSKDQLTNICARAGFLLRELLK